MPYGIEVNEPYQANSEFKLRCLVVAESDGQYGYKAGWTPSEDFDGPNPRAAGFDDEEDAQKIADLLPPTADARVVPIEGGSMFNGDRFVALGKALTRQQKVAAQQAREVR